MTIRESEHYGVLKSNTYGPSRERLSVAAGQAELFNEIEATLDITEAIGIEPELAATPLREETPSTGKPGRSKLAAHLPRVEYRHELTETERRCECGAELAEIGAEVSEQLDYVPANVQVLRHVQLKYACRSVVTHCFFEILYARAVQYICQIRPDRCLFSLDTTL